MNPYNINPLEEQVLANELNHVDVATLRIWRNELLDSIACFVNYRDYDHPILEEHIRNFEEVNTALKRNIYHQNKN